MPFQEYIVQTVKFYEYRNTVMWFSFVYNKQWKKYSIHITPNYSYIKDGVTKLWFNIIYFLLNLPLDLSGSYFQRINTLNNWNRKMVYNFISFNKFIFTFLILKQQHKLHYKPLVMKCLDMRHFFCKDHRVAKTRMNSAATRHFAPKRWSWYTI